MARIGSRLQATSLLVVLIAIPLCAQMELIAPPTRSGPPLCFTSGSATYRLANGPADYSVRIVEAAAPEGAAQADLRLQLVDDPQDADFVLVDDARPGEGEPCQAAALTRTVQIVDANADVTVSLSTDPHQADHGLYVHSARFSHADAAALMAVMWKVDRARQLAANR